MAKVGASVKIRNPKTDRITRRKGRVVVTSKIRRNVQRQG